MAPPSSGRARIRVAPYVPSYMADGQQCVVCADKATGLHYRAITCEGCKGFFRRVFQNSQRYSCKDGGGSGGGQGCAISKSTRNACQKCRLDKCLAQGMDPQLVLDEVHRKAKRSLIERNRVRKQLERVQSRVRRASAVDDTEADRLWPSIRRWTRSYWTLFGIPWEMGEREGQEEGPSPMAAEGGEQQQQGTGTGTFFWRELLQRVVRFGQSMLLEREVDSAEGPEALLLSPELGWLSVLLLSVVVQSGGNTEDEQFLSPPRPANAPGDKLQQPKESKDDSGMGEEDGPRLRLDELHLPSQLREGLLWMAGTLRAMELTDCQTALVAGLLLFWRIQKLSSLRSHLLRALRLCCAHNLAAGDSLDERLAQWPVLVARMSQLEQMAQEHREQLLTGGQCAGELARLMAQ